MDENSTEIKIDHRGNGPDPEVEKHLEEESMAAMAPSEPDADGEEVTISTKTADLEVEATEPAETEELKEEAKPEIAEKPAKTEANDTKKTNTLIVAVIVVLFVLALSVIGAVLIARYLGQ